MTSPFRKQVLHRSWKRINSLKYIRLLRALLSARRQRNVVRRLSDTLQEMNRLGRQLGWGLVRAGNWKEGVQLIRNPVVLVRHFEFEFAYDAFPEHTSTALDVSSPRLFPLYLARAYPDVQITVLNPDPTDIAITQDCAKLLGLKNIGFVNQSLQSFQKEAGTYDFISSISVVEHVAGEIDDSKMLELMLNHLAAEGRMVLTVPLSAEKHFETEYLPVGKKPYEGTHGEKDKDGRYFFQNLYDYASLDCRLFSAYPDRDISVSWWGETRTGFYKDYTSGPHYKRGGDIERYLSDFRRYNSWEEMPGMGIAGIAIE